MIQFGHIRIKDNGIYFEPKGLEKPINPGIDGSFTEDITYIKRSEEYVASKQLIEVSNIKYPILLHPKIILGKSLILAEDGQPCEAEVENNKAIIIKMN